MRHARATRRLGIAGLAIAVAAAAVAFAQSTVTALPDNAPVQTAPLGTAALSDLKKTKWGDPKKGAAVAGACAACHGLDGNSTVNPALYPRIAGQSERYLAHQLSLFKAGLRTDGNAALMTPYAMALSAQDMRDLGAYYATQKSGAGIADDAEIATGPNAGMKVFQVGEKLYHSGDAARGLPACMACHGPTGAGNPGPAYPHIGGQQSWYVVQRLQQYRAGTTRDPEPAQFNVMAAVAHPLTDEDINAVATYVQGLHPRADDIGEDGAPLPPVPAAAVPAPAPATATPPSPPAASADTATGTPAPASSDAAAATTPSAPAAPAPAAPAASEEAQTTR